jgi:hypothetical protein
MNWYHVQDSDRVGPVDDGELERLLARLETSANGSCSFA